jgi:hypothetical protein
VIAIFHSCITSQNESLKQNLRFGKTATLTKPQVRLRTEPGRVCSYGNYDRYGDPSFRTVDAKSINDNRASSNGAERKTQRQAKCGKRRKRDEREERARISRPFNSYGTRSAPLKQHVRMWTAPFIHSYHFAQLKVGKYIYLFIYLWKIGKGVGG